MAKQQPQHVVFYEAGQDENYQRELTIIRDLPTALEQGQLFMVYQPKVDLSSRRCVAAEALIRWVHPTLGFIPPDEFIGLLEHSGNIQQLSQWVIKTVIAQQVMWQQAGIMVQIAINLSANDLLDTDLPQQLVQAMQAVHLSPSCLALEVTESAVMADTDTVVQVLNALKASGFKLSIDDFGTGHSSLAYLRNLPVQELKIDRAFVKDIVDSPSDKLIVETTVKLAHGMGLRVTAEGLEDVAGLAILTGLGCDKVQGYFFSKPLPAQAFIDWLDEFATHTERWWPISVDY
jgi:EAL domain-containing protein (putative c-di-GMP-specific phosphodiesterase class I)